MAPPPATPTPHRFLVPKRSQPRSETTPKPAFQSSGRQFQATPRFSLHSTPRPGTVSGTSTGAGTGPSSSLTPFRHRGTERDILIDSSPPPLPTAGYVDEYDDGNHINDGAIVNVEHVGDRIDYEQDSTVDEDSPVQESSSSQGTESDGEDHDWSRGRRATKRRRISVSSSFDVGAEEMPLRPDIEREMDVVEMGDPLLDPESPFSEPSVTEKDLDLDSDKEAPEDDTQNIPRFSSPPPHFHDEKQSPKAHQPTFQRAPRFKPAEIPEGAPRPEPLPDAFSPRRKGAKYVQGGLAAELRDWLVDVEAGIGSGSASASGQTTTAAPGARRDEEWVARIRVDSLRGANGNARGMALVLGRQVLDGGDGRSQDAGEEGGEEALGTSTVRLILAGLGRLSGLGVGHDVRPGVVLGIARPTWEVVLDDLGRWAVACDWVVLR
ncbi:hypothetical protein F5Y14DRAFT_416357 [Nemania sp. NC0429]|nr:hypothetical protein F5Y14DRAFT_416357 [Nemania sp. NC0429]